MTIKKNFLSIFLVIFAFFSLMYTFNVYAEQEIIYLSEDLEMQPEQSNGCNQYGRTDWPSIEDACNYYLGNNNWTYYPDTNTWRGAGLIIQQRQNLNLTYNYFYTFSDGTRMYFGGH